MCELVDRALPADEQWTFVRIVDKGTFPFTMSGFVKHKRDLSDLAEPYLSAVKEVRAHDR